MQKYCRITVIKHSPTCQKRHRNGKMDLFCQIMWKMPMSDLRTRMGISSIEDVIRYNRLCCFGDLQRMDEEKWPRNIWNFKVNGSYPPGCPKKKWFDNIRNDLGGQLLWLYIVLNGEMQSSHPNMLQSPTLAVGEKKDVKLDSK